MATRKYIPRFAFAAIAGFTACAVLGGCGYRKDWSTPKVAARTFYVALLQGDAATARASIADAQAGMFDEIKALAEGIVAAKDAAKQRFGESGDAVSGGLPSLDELESCQEQIEGDAATLTFKNRNTLPVKLRKIADKWKVDVAQTLSLPSGKAREILKSVVAAVSAHAQKIRSGDFKNAADAEVGLQNTIRQQAVGSVIRNLLPIR
jgi:hypothetical protein